MKKGLLALAFGGLSIGMTEFTMMGILPDIAADMGLKIPVAAHLIALYALGVFVGAPILVLCTGKLAPKKILISLMLVFFVFNGIFALAHNYWSMQLARFMSGLPHGAFFGVGSVVAAKMAPTGKKAQYISIMFTGMTVANLLGVPLGTYLGHHYSWKITYAIISFFGLLTSFTLYFWLPDISSDPSNKVVQQLSYFKKSEAWLLVVLISIGTGGLFAWISYISPLVTKVSGIIESRVPIIMFLVGLGMFFGNLLGGKLADSISPTKASMICFFSMSICLILVYFTSPIQWTAYPMAFITGVISFTIGSPIQMMLIRSAEGAETIAAAAGQACFNMGNTLGAYLGGIPITLGLAYSTPLLVGSGLSFMGLVGSFIFYKTMLVNKNKS
ncbi:MFS transporter [Elizabethkingia argentiflava]|uniref:MFS transporter n=1 Tax=Elizabethkingia argenteiflava TaxID=2681556 RepID=A0A845PUB9_9FLAO|nr:MFS transporter [Elizabethkingia argenteiflava]NAW51424.1 MFS transporter [Elizabethkingia argenteiflava]